MDPEASVCNPFDLERLLLDERAEPRNLRLSLLESITDNFSDDLEIGRGGFAVVYKGLLRNCSVAVKKLAQTQEVHEMKFLQEVDSLMSVKHKNIVRFLGYCSDTQGKMSKFKGKNVMAEERQRFLCFEYLPGSLDKYIKDPSGGHEWRTCYHIVKGICEGLHYLHQQNIVHLDLKPENILLDQYMVPKIADFGLSRRFDEKQSRLMTSNLYGSLGYMAPEFYGGLITFKSDVYSLGIIILEILTGQRGYPETDDVLTARWRISEGDLRLEHVRECTDIGLQCIDPIAANRPKVEHIVEMLGKMDPGAMDGVLERMLLDESAEPTDLPFSLQESITNNFSAQKIGMEGFAFVYKGVPENGRAPQAIYRQTHSALDQYEVIYGRDMEKAFVVKLLLDQQDQQNVQVLPIIGMGGLGQTTLAKMVYNDRRVQKHFELKMWHCVSEDFEVTVVLRSIIQLATKAICILPDTIELLRGKLQEVIGRQRFLLILDDVWNDDLRPLLCSSIGGPGSMIVVTTRSPKVAFIMGTLPPHILKYLSKDDSWELFFEEASSKGMKEQEEFVAIGRRIVNKSMGLPLSLKIMGGLMSSKKRVKEWEDIAAALRY